MSSYRRYYQNGGCYFFTVVTYKRTPILTSQENVNILRYAFKKVQKDYPFILQAIVILPDHLHCLWKLPTQCADFSLRWKLIKRYFSVEIQGEVNHRNEKNIWQRRFWEHMIRDEDDWQRHIDYIHYNPVKHGYIKTPNDWAFSSFRYWVKKGFYEYDWGKNEPLSISKMYLE